MRYPFLRAFFAICLVAAPAARAADKAAPALSPEAASVKAAMKTFYESLEANDVPGIRSAFHTTNQAETDLADAYAGFITAAKSLGDAAKTKYGATGDALSKGIPAREAISRLEQAEITVDGDSATFKAPGQAKALRLARSEGRWRIFVADYAGGPADKLDAQTAVIREMGGVFSAVAADVMADKYPNPQDAQRTLQQKLQALVFASLQKVPPTTRPATTKTTTAPATPAK